MTADLNMEEAKGIAKDHSDLESTCPVKSRELQFNFWLHGKINPLGQILLKNWNPEYLGKISTFGVPPSSEEHATLDLKVVSLSATLGIEIT